MTTENKSVPDSWENRIEQFAKIVGLSTEEVEKALAEKPFELTKDTPYVLEMFSDDSITPFGDFRKIFCDDIRVVSLPKLRLGIKYLRGSKEKRDEATTQVDPDLMSLQTKYGIKTRFADLGPEELIPYYKPTKQNRISKALKDMFNDRKVIAFKPDSKKVAVEETINYITDVNDGLPEEDAIEVDGELVRLYAIGQVPNKVIEEDPLFEGQPLKRGRSVVNRVNWSTISKEKRQFVRILVNEDEINPNDRMHVRQLVQDLTRTMDSIKGLYPESYMLFKELQKQDDLPKLQLSLDEVNGKTNNPFAIGRNRSF